MCIRVSWVDNLLVIFQVSRTAGFFTNFIFFAFLYDVDSTKELQSCGANKSSIPVKFLFLPEIFLPQLISILLGFSI